MPDGPPLKMYVSGHEPARTVIGIYSLILNGFRPSDVTLFGEHQWSATSREIFAELLPFCDFVSTSRVLDDLHGLAGPKLAQWAEAYWHVMKTCVALLQPPNAFCMMDDDVFILDTLEDALTVFKECDLVYCGDFDHDAKYASTWRIPQSATPPRQLNAGLYFARPSRQVAELAGHMLSCPPSSVPNYVWEQGLITWAYAEGSSSHLLSTQKYFYPLIDGLPGGFARYDYRTNPCGFTSIHFGGSTRKPNDALSLLLADDILMRRT
jgi:hypothetical protein